MRLKQLFVVLATCLMVGCGTKLSPVPGTTNKAGTPNSENGGQLKKWEFPEAEQLRGGKVGDVFSADYGTSKSFEEVWTYYAKKVGYKQEYQPNLTHGESVGSNDGGEYQIQILNSTNDPAIAKARRPTAKSATLMRRGAGRNVTVFI